MTPSVSDGGGTYLFVTSTAKCWRMNYRFDGKQKTLALGIYPAVSLAQAHQCHEEVRELLAAVPPVDPRHAKRKESNQGGGSGTDTGIGNAAVVGQDERWPLYQHAT